MGAQFGRSAAPKPAIFARISHNGGEMSAKRQVPDSALPVPVSERALTIPYSVRALAELSEDTPPTHCPHNLDCSTEEGVAKVLNLAGKGHASVPQGGEFRLRLHEWIVLPDVIMDEETGEMKPLLRVVLSDGNGRSVMCASSVMPKRLKQILMSYRPERIAAGLPIAVIDRASRRPGRHYHDIRVLAPGEECP